MIVSSEQFCEPCRMMAATRTIRVDSNQAIGERLKLLRRAFGDAQKYSREMKQSEIARQCGISVQAWNNAETGDNRIGLDNAMRIRERTGAGLDFIYFGVRSGLPLAIALAVERLEKADKLRAPKRA